MKEKVLVIEDWKEFLIITGRSTKGGDLLLKKYSPGNLLASFGAEVGAFEKGGFGESPQKKPGLLLTFAEDTGIKKGDNVTVLILEGKK